MIQNLLVIGKAHVSNVPRIDHRKQIDNVVSNIIVELLQFVIRDLR